MLQQSITQTATPVIAKWFETDTARRILNDIASDADSRPMRFRCSDRLPITGPKEWVEYDRDDARVQALEASRTTYLDAVAAISPLFLADAGQETELDAAIEAAIEVEDARIARDEVYADCLNAGMTIGAARARAYGEARA